MSLLIPPGIVNCRIGSLESNKETGVSQWRWQGVPENKPLYHKEQLSTLPVLIVEGEKAANVTVSGYTVVTWAGGTNAVSKTDWSPLDGREIVIWGDRDVPGQKAVKAIKKMFPTAKEVPVQYAIGNGQDIADIDDPALYLDFEEEEQAPTPKFWFDPISSRYYFNGKSFKKEAFTQIYTSTFKDKPNMTIIPIIYTTYDPHRPDTYVVDGDNYHNLFIPSKITARHGTFTNIMRLLDHLTGDQQVSELFINWLAVFRQTLNKSRVAWVFQPEQLQRTAACEKHHQDASDRQYFYV